MIKYKVLDEDKRPIRVFFTKEEATNFLQDGWSIVRIQTPDVRKTAAEKVGDAPF